MYTTRTFIVSIFMVLGLAVADHLSAQQTTRLANELKEMSLAELAEEAVRLGDSDRGAMIFFKPQMTCAKCHDENAYRQQLAPRLTEPQENLANPGQYLVESILFPSKHVRRGFETVHVLKLDGSLVSGVLIENDDDQIIVADPSNDGKHITVLMSEVDDWNRSTLSSMPEDLANLLGSKSEFLDLLAYLNAIAEGGANRALELRPAESMFALAPIPEYEKRVDHSGLISSLNDESFDRGQEIYLTKCINCHGTLAQVGSLPTSLRFGEGRFKNGADPHSMYKTLTHGYGMMVPQSWLVPQQKYDVIHYIREHFLRDQNPEQYTKLTDHYLTSLPVGDSRGPDPVLDRPWQTMDYGPVMMNTIEVGKDGKNFAYKGIIVRLDPGEGGVANGHHWAMFDHDTMRMSAIWSASGEQKFIDWHGIHFDGQHNIHPRVVGAVQVSNPNGPGWAKRGSSDDFTDNERVLGRDGRNYGPLPNEWAKFRGRYDYDHKTVLHYTVGETDVWEMPGMEMIDGRPLYTRTFRIGPHTEPLALQVAREAGLTMRGEGGSVSSLREVTLVPTENALESAAVESEQSTFSGQRYFQLDSGQAFDMTEQDYTVAAWIKTSKDGTIFCKTENSDTWIEDGKSLFIRDGRLVFDIGWVGAVSSRARVDDGNAHHVALTWESNSGAVKLFVDGKLSGEGELAPHDPVDGHIVRIGYTADNFPDDSFFDGQISRLQFFQKRLSDVQVASLAKGKLAKGKLDLKAEADWELADATESSWATADEEYVAAAIDGTTEDNVGLLTVGVTRELNKHEWSFTDDHDLRLTIPANSQHVQFSLYLHRADTVAAAEAISADSLKNVRFQPLETLVRGGPKRWATMLETETVRGDERQAFAVDILRRPEKNPWNCRLRLTGLDFFEDGNKAAVCTWDGSVFIVRGLLAEDGRLTWQRVASGLFQPLGIKIVEETMFVSCRDQLVRLHDLNGDDEIDFYECFNNDHQVTDHFHEFAMGLQRDDRGNFYYAKSARHALPAVVPHHGTLLKISADGAKTEIVANGFRAANGVCINADGSFFVTDQEGHWTPKNRINRVVEGGFYGNMLGYHDVDDDSDEAMEQPLVWITNQIDRSPGELLWVESKQWGRLDGKLLNLSYGMGQIFVVPHEQVGAKWQGGVIALPLPPFPTGIMRGRFHPVDQQLYCCGMVAWSSNQQQPGGLYRVRATGKPMNLPADITSKPGRLFVKFTDPIDEASAGDLANWAIKTWDLKRSGDYGSDHLNEKRLEINGSRVIDGTTVELSIDELKPTWGMEIRYSFKSKSGSIIRGRVHNSIYQLGK